MKRWLLRIGWGILFAAVVATVSLLVTCSASGNKGVDASKPVTETTGDIEARGDVTINQGLRARDVGWLALLGWAWHWRRSRLATRVADSVANEIETLRPTPDYRRKAVSEQQRITIEELVHRLANKQGPQWRWFAQRVRKATKK